MGRCGVHLRYWSGNQDNGYGPQVISWHLCGMFNRLVASGGRGQGLYLTYEKAFLVRELFVFRSVCQKARQESEQAFSILRQDSFDGV